MNNYKFFLYSNFILIFFLFYLKNIHNNQIEIISKKDSIKYVFLEKYCHNSSRLSSQLKILYKNKIYYVDVNSETCSNFNLTNKSNIKFYYNKDRDVVFIENEINKIERGLKVLVGLIFINTLYLIYNFKNRRSP